MFDWSGSENVANVQVLWPAPHRFSDGLGVSIGYSQDVVLPLHVTAKDPGKPVRLALALSYAVCKEVCVPLKGEAILRLAPGDNNPAVAMMVAEAEKAVPRVVPWSEMPLHVTVDTGASPPQLSLVTQIAGVDLLLEGPPDVLISQPEQQPPLPPAAVTYHYRAILQPPQDRNLSGIALQVTLVPASGQALESTYTIP